MIKKKKTWTPKDGWHHIPGYCVYVKDNMVQRYYAEEDETMTVLYPEGGDMKWNTFRTRMAQKRKMTEAAEV